MKIKIKLFEEFENEDELREITKNLLITIQRFENKESYLEICKELGSDINFDPSKIFKIIEWYYWENFERSIVTDAAEIIDDLNKKLEKASSFKEKNGLQNTIDICNLIKEGNLIGLKKYYSELYNNNEIFNYFK